MRSPEKKRNGRWQIRYADQHGQIKYKSFRTKGDAEKFGRDAQGNVEAGLAPTYDKTITDLCDEFERAHFHGLRPSSVKDAGAGIARIQRHFGQRKLTSIHPPDIEKFRDGELIRMRAEHEAVLDGRLARLRLAAGSAVRKDNRARLLADLAKLEGEAPAIRERIATMGVRTVNKVLQLFRQLYEFAKGRRYAAHNPADHVRKLKAADRQDRAMDVNVLTPGELLKLIEAADPHGRAAIAVLGFGGLRLGELLGLQWGDVELDRARIVVRRQLEAVTGELREPKTRAGTRFVSLPPVAISELRRWKLACPKGEAEFCFPNSDGGAQDDRNFRARVFYPALRRARLRRIRVHDLRHSCASMLIATGADLAAISRQLGHANVNITLTTYTHWFEKRATSDLGDRLAALVEKETGCVLVASDASAEGQSAEVVDLMVARSGIEPPTRGFSVRCSTN